MQVFWKKPKGWQPLIVKMNVKSVYIILRIFIHSFRRQFQVQFRVIYRIIRLENISNCAAIIRDIKTKFQALIILTSFLEWNIAIRGNVRENSLSQVLFSDYNRNSHAVAVTMTTDTLWWTIFLTSFPDGWSNSCAFCIWVNRSIVRRLWRQRRPCDKCTPRLCVEHRSRKDVYKEIEHHIFNLRAISYLFCPFGF